MKQKSSIQLSIPEPCSQDWEQMTPDAQGRFCAYCQKSVIDFTTWSDADLYTFFSKNDQSVCGRFQSQQLNRTIQLPVQKPTRLYRIAIALGLGLMFTQLPTMHARPRPPLMEQNVLAQEIPQNDTTGSDSLVIRGLVLDATKQPAIGAAVNVIQNSETIGSTSTDIDGNFEIMLTAPQDKKHLQLKITYVGHVTTAFPYVESTKKLVLQLKENRNSSGLVAVTINYGHPILDSLHPGPNSTFSREQINNMSH